MLQGNRKLIFDTSGVSGTNALCNDPDKEALISGMRLLYRVGITETLLNEVAANSSAEKRLDLLGLLKRMLAFSDGIMPYNWIFETQAKAYLERRETFDWRLIDVRCKPVEDEIARQEIVHSESGNIVKLNRAAEKRFRGIFRKAREAVPVVLDDDGQPPSLEYVMRELVDEWSPILALGLDMFEKVTGIRVGDDEFKSFVGRCPPVRALLSAMAFSQFDRSIRAKLQPRIGRDAGMRDMFSAVYLPYCNVFVTDDEGQGEALRAIAQFMSQNVTILMYSEFKRSLGLLGLAA